VPILFFSSLWALSLSFIFSGMHYWINKYRNLSHLGGTSILLAQYSSLWAFGFMEPIILAYISGLSLFGMMSLPKNTLGRLLIFSIIYITLLYHIPELSSEDIWLPYYGLIKSSSFMIITFNGFNLALFSYSLGCITIISSLSVSYLLFLWGLLLIFFSHTAFGSPWGWPFFNLEQIAAINLGSLVGFFILSSAPALISLHAFSAMALGGALGVLFCFLKVSILLWAIGFMPIILSLFQKKSKTSIFSYFQSQGYHESIITLGLCGTSTILSAIILKALHVLSA